MIALGAVRFGFGSDCHGSFNGQIFAKSMSATGPASKNSETLASRPNKAGARQMALRRIGQLLSQ
jgi:hypothetical protein